MNNKILTLLLLTFVLFGCDLGTNLDNPDNPFEEYAGRMIERIRIKHNNYSSDYVYYDYDRRGRILSIENTYYGTLHNFTYIEDKYGDYVVLAKNNLGENREIILNWNGHAEEEIAYINKTTAESVEYSYIGNKLRSVDVEEYYNDGSIFSQERYDFNYKYDNNLESIQRYYEEYDYDIYSRLTFSGFSRYENDYNVDILSVLDLYIDCDYSSLIGRTGKRSSYLPTKAILKVKRNGRYDKDVIYDINYIGSNGLISAIEISSSIGMRKTLYISYL